MSTTITITGKAISNQSAAVFKPKLRLRSSVNFEGAASISCLRCRFQ